MIKQKKKGGASSRMSPKKVNAISNRSKKKNTTSHFSLKNLSFLSAFCALILAIAGVSISTVNQTVQAKEREIRLSEAVSFCESLFDANSAIKSDKDKSELKDCSSRLDEIEQNPDYQTDADKLTTLRIQISDALDYLAWNDEAGNYIDENNTVKDTVSEQDLISLREKFDALADQYHPLLQEKLDYIQSEYNAMRAAEDAVNKLFTSEDRAEPRTNASRAEYNDAKSKVDELKQENLKNTLNESLDKSLKSIEEQERIAWKRAEQARKAREEEQRKIAESWHRLDLSPYYINQFSAHIYNGCEAASLLMSLKFKGYLRGTDFHSFAMNMPTADDPNQGFYLSITELEPKTEAHWIAPAPLARYGASMSGAAVANVSGYSLDQLDNEVKNGNPVIIYLTYAMKNPKEYSKGVPKNLHVVVLAGYNEYTGEQIIYDPWPVTGGATTTLSKARAEYLYSASGRRAVVVR